MSLLYRIPLVRRAGRRTAVLAAALAVLTVIASPATADTLANNVTSGGNDTITAGGSTTITYTLTATSNDGQGGCNATGANPATMSISKPGQVTGPTSATLTGCGATPVTFGSAVPGDYPIAVTVTGGRGGTYSTTPAAFTLHVRAADTAGPVLTLPADQVVEAAGASGATVTWVATAFDAGDDAARPVACSPASGTTFPLGATTVTCSAEDSRGNRSSASFTVTVRDTQAPALTLADQSAEAVGPDGATVAFNPAPAATDAVSGARAVTCSPASGSTFPLGATQVTCAATDAAGNAATGTFTVTVRDTLAPSLTLTNRTVEATSAAGAAVTYEATAADAVTGDVPVTCDVPSGATFPLGTTTVRCAAADAAGNTAEGTFQVAVGDTMGPELTLASLSAEATGPGGAAVEFTPAPAAVDAVAGDVAVTCDAASGDTFAVGVTTVRCSAADTAGHETSGSFTVTVADRTAPALVLTDVVAEATGPDGAAVTLDPAPTAADLVDGARPVTCTPASGDAFPLGETTVTCSATDTRGNGIAGSLVVTVRDTTGPALALPAEQVTEATGPDGAMVTWLATAQDVVSGDVDVNCDPSPGTTFPLGASTVVCRARDAAGNGSEDAFTVRVLDLTPPSYPAADLTAEATGPAGAAVEFAGTATDLVDGDVPAGCDAASGDVFALGTTTVTCVPRDTSGNFQGYTFTVTVRDTTAPALALPAGLTVEATGPDGAAVDYAGLVSAEDAVSGQVEVSCDVPAGTFGLGTATVRCSAADGAGNTASGSFDVTVRDTTAPALTLDSFTVEATGPAGAAVEFAPTATDLVDGDVAVECDAGTGATFPLGVTTVACTARDGAGNAAAGSFTIDVTDHTAPTLRLQDAQAEATGPDGAPVEYAASASDVVDGDRPVACDPASGSLFPLGDTAVGCSASDLRGNSAQGQLTVRVTDTTAPVLTVAGATVEATGPDGATASYTATASDVVDGDVAVECDRASGAVFGVGTTTVTCTATDARGNSAGATLEVRVLDTTAPVVTVPGDRQVEATGADGAAVTWIASAEDIVAGALAAACAPASGDTFALGATTVTCSATDAAGNTGTASFVVSVVDTTAPAVTVADVVAEATGAAGAPVTFAATAADVVDGPVATTCDRASGSVFPLGTTVVTCGAVDAAGNAGAAAFTVVVRDTTAPGLTVPGAIAVPATSAAGAAVTYSATASDLVDAAPSVTCDVPSGAVFAPGVTTVTCLARDAAGNVGAAKSFTVSVTFAWSGVLSPLNANGTSVYKIGSTVPVKFALTGAGAAISTLPAKLYYAKVSSDTAGVELEASSTSAADAGNAFRYDPVAKQYVFNLSTKTFTQGTYRLRIDLGDGVSHTVDLTSRK